MGGHCSAKLLQRDQPLLPHDMLKKKEKSSALDAPALWEAVSQQTQAVQCCQLEGAEVTAGTRTEFAL